MAMNSLKSMRPLPSKSKRCMEASTSCTILAWDRGRGRARAKLDLHFSVWVRIRVRVRGLLRELG